MADDNQMAALSSVMLPAIAKAVGSKIDIREFTPRMTLSTSRDLKLKMCQKLSIRLWDRQSPSAGCKGQLSKTSGIPFRPGLNSQHRLSSSVVLTYMD